MENALGSAGQEGNRKRRKNGQGDLPSTHPRHHGHVAWRLVLLQEGKQRKTQTERVSPLPGAPTLPQGMGLESTCPLQIMRALQALAGAIDSLWMPCPGDPSTSGPPIPSCGPAISQTVWPCMCSDGLAGSRYPATPGRRTEAAGLFSVWPWHFSLPSADLPACQLAVRLVLSGQNCFSDL